MSPRSGAARGETASRAAIGQPQRSTVHGTGATPHRDARPERLRAFLRWCSDKLVRNPWPIDVMPRIQESPSKGLGDDEVTKLVALPDPGDATMLMLVSVACKAGDQPRATTTRAPVFRMSAPDQRCPPQTAAVHSRFPNRSDAVFACSAGT